VMQNAKLKWTYVLVSFPVKYSRLVASLDTFGAILFHRAANLVDSFIISSCILLVIPIDASYYGRGTFMARTCAPPAATQTRDSLG